MKRPKLMIIGGSAGSLQVILGILPEIHPDFPVPILIVLHRNSGFESSLEELLASRTQTPIKEVEEKDHIRTWQPPITGEKIMELFGLPPSKPVGILKDALKEAMLDGIIPNTYEAALSFILEKGEEMGLKVKG